MMKIALAVCAILMLASGCSPAENRTQDESPARTSPDPHADVENTLPEEVEEQASAELLSSLEDLLPEQFGALAR
jgi:PBP1b-binding outer membrane lipoprotein LpoB